MARITLIYDWVGLDDEIPPPRMATVTILDAAGTALKRVRAPLEDGPVYFEGVHGTVSGVKVHVDGMDYIEQVRTPVSVKPFERFSVELRYNLVGWDG